MDEEPEDGWLINPQDGRRHMAATKTRHRKKHHRVRHRKKHHHNPKMRHHTRRRHHNAMRHHTRRRHHRNPFSSGGGSVWGQIGLGIAGLVSTRILGNLAYNTLVPVGYQGPAAKIATKAAIVFTVAWGVSKIWPSTFRPLLIGGAMDIIEDALVNFVTPSFPLLSAYPGLSTGALSAYPGMSGWRQPDNASFGGNDEM